jgi:iron donor protein CyaY
MDEQEFRLRADKSIERLFRALSEAGDDYGFEADLNSGALTVEFDEPPAKFVVSPNAPVKQIWVSALSKSFKLGWDEAESAFVLEDTGQTLLDLMGDVVGKQLGQNVEL